MSNLLILSPIAIDGADITPSSQALNFPGSHLGDPQPKVIWKAALSGQVDIDIDLKSDQTVDTVFLGFTNAEATTNWDIRMASEAQGSTYLDNAASIRKADGALRISSDNSHPNFHGVWTGASVQARYVRLRITQNNTPFEAGVVALGQAFRPTYNYDWGSGRSLTDLSTTKTLRGGQTDVAKDAIIPNWRFVLSNLSDVELENLWKITKKHGKSTPLLIIEDPNTPGDLQEATHYGTLRDINAYERRNASKSRWEFTIQHWQ